MLTFYVPDANTPARACPDAASPGEARAMQRQSSPFPRTGGAGGVQWSLNAGTRDSTGVIFTFLVGYRVRIFITVCVISTSCVPKVHPPVSACLPARPEKHGGWAGVRNPPPLTPTTRPISMSLYSGVNKSAAFLQQRRYHGENTSSRSIT